MAATGYKATIIPGREGPERLGRPAPVPLPATLKLGEGQDCEPVWEPWMARAELQVSLCLPEALATKAVVTRLTDPAGAQRILDEPVLCLR